MASPLYQRQVTREQMIEVLERVGLDESNLDDSHPLGRGGRECMAVVFKTLGQYTSFVTALALYWMREDELCRDPGFELEWFYDVTMHVDAKTITYAFPRVVVMKGE